MILKSDFYRSYDYKWLLAYRWVSGNSKIQESIFLCGFSVVTNSAHHKWKSQSVFSDLTDFCKPVDRFTFYFSSRHAVEQINSVQPIRLGWAFLHEEKRCVWLTVTGGENKSVGQKPVYFILFNSCYRLISSGDPLNNSYMRSCFSKQLIFYFIAKEAMDVDQLLL